MNQLLQDQNLISILGIQSLPEEKRIEILEKVSDLVQKRLLVRILDALKGQEREDLMSLLDGGDSNRVEEFIKQHLPSLPEWLREETIALKKELSTMVQEIE